MRFSRMALIGATIAFAAAIGLPAYAAHRSADTEDYVREPMPPGFQVVATELEGPVFADARARTFYKWPRKDLRNGNAGEIQYKPTCDSQIFRENVGLMSPYPGGLELPEAATRPSCTDVWPPVLASADAKPIGKWTIVERPDGRKQWAHDGWSLYTSILDTQAGETLGGSPMIGTFNNAGAPRIPVGPEANVPSQFTVTSTMLGRMVTLRNGWSVYSYDGDNRNKANCTGACLAGWLPVLAADYARPLGEWTIFERAPGVKQWAFKGKPVYQHLNDRKTRSQDGSDVRGWSNVYTQRTPEPPPGFAMKETSAGLVLGDSEGRTVYRYQCYEDTPDQLTCDTPETPQAYRFAVCGAFDVTRCVKAFPYVVAPANAKTNSQTWGTMYIDPKTGKRATQKQPGALHVWTFRARPVYTFAGDKKPTDVNAHNWGEFNAEWNGFKMLMYRDLYSTRAEAYEP